MNLNSKEKPVIIYPTNWAYKIIGLDVVALQNAVKEMLGVRKYELTTSNKSSSGKYVSLNLSLIVNDEGERVDFFKELANHSDVKMVI